MPSFRCENNSEKSWIESTTSYDLVYSLFIVFGFDPPDVLCVQEVLSIFMQRVPCGNWTILLGKTVYKDVIVILL